MYCISNNERHIRQHHVLCEAVTSCKGRSVSLPWVWYNPEMLVGSQVEVLESSHPKLLSSTGL